MRQYVTSHILLRGLILLGVIGFGAYVIHANGLWTLLLVGDKSYLSLAIITLWVVVSARWFYLLRWVERQKIQPQLDPILVESEYARRLNHGWFAADVALKLGLLGTVIGFILMLASIRDITGFDTTSLQSALKAMSGGMAVALYTTLAGLVCNLLLRVQFQMLADAMHAHLCVLKEAVR